MLPYEICQRKWDGKGEMKIKIKNQKQAANHTGKPLAYARDGGIA